MSARFAIAVQWPNDPRLHLVHLQKPYFVAAVHCSNAEAWFCTNLSRRQLAGLGGELNALLRAASEFFASAVGVSLQQAHFIKGEHGHEFPRFLMARTEEATTFIVEPDHPAPLVEVRDAAETRPASKAPARFDVVTQWRLGEMRKYYQQFVERQRAGQDVPASAAPKLAA